MTRWYTHRWNSATSLRLIFTVIPRVPRFVVPAIGGITAAVCLACLRSERQAAHRNLHRVLGVNGWRLRLALWRLFYNFSRFMVSYCDLPHLTLQQLRERVSTDEASKRRITGALDRGRGAVILTAHIGNWEAGVRFLETSGAPVNVAMRVDRESAAERWLRRLRERDGVRVVDVGDDPGAVLALRAALARNEIVAMQGDRAVGDRTITCPLFGRPFAFPLGPFLLAYRTGAPLLPAFVLLEGWRRWSVEVLPAVPFPSTENTDADLAAGAQAYAAELERAIRGCPVQWFNFYDAWGSG